MGITAPQVNERLAALTAAGTSVWLDQIRRSLIETGELERMVEQDSLRGVTSNPAIFEKAIMGSPDYDDHLEQLAREGKSGREVYRHLAVTDVQLAADVLRGVWEESQGADGYVSIEVAPRLARDTEGTIEQARMYWELVDRPNTLIKIPGTPEGLPAIEQMLYEGVNINVTLLFSVDAYADVTEAYIRALERRAEESKPLNLHSVASFFVSRVDTEVDKRLEKVGRNDLAGHAGIANARAAYRRFKEIFEGERFAALREAGAPVQRPLWASTGVKNPNYSDVMYVEGLVGPHTVNTMPMATLLAAGEHAEIEGNTAEKDPSPILDELAEVGIDMDDVTAQLLDEGIEKFIEPMEKLLAGVESRREAVVIERPRTITSLIPDELQPPIAERIRKAAAADVARRIWKHDETLWGGPGPEIGDRLGWLTIADRLSEEVDELQRFAAECYEDGLRDAVLLGMGGSSLAPEVFRRSFGERDGALRLHVLDTTDATTILRTQRAVKLEETLFIVSSKSGGTIETLSHFKHFHELATGALGDDAGSHFVAITDPGTKLADMAREHGFRRLFENDPEIGGRYSALSYFGLVPAALMGADIGVLLDRAGIAEQASVSYDSSSANSGLWLGLALGELALQGRDKFTFVVPGAIASFGLWVEQLIAESTGKHGKGALPVAGEPLGDPGVYGDDRVFVYLRDGDDPDAGTDKAIAALGKAGHPILQLSVHGPTDLGRIFFFAEFGVAVAGWTLGINPFDQPNVQEAKDNTNKVLADYESRGELPALDDAGDDQLRALLSEAAPPDYVAIMAYVPFDDAFEEAIDELRATIRDATKATTTFGYGPRFLHSTGQYHKGGPKQGRFLQLVADGDEDVEAPGEPYSFTTLKNAQAIGDLQTLREHGLPAERVRLDGSDPTGSLRELTARIKGML